MGFLSDTMTREAAAARIMARESHLPTDAVLRRMSKPEVTTTGKFGRMGALSIGRKDRQRGF
jgi:hypothetical protein